MRVRVKPPVNCSMIAAGTRLSALGACLGCLISTAELAAYGQPHLDPAKPISHLRYQVWGTQDGLPQNTVQAIAQAPDGYLWVGTELGLARFDGLRFTVFDRSNTPELKNNSISAVWTPIFRSRSIPRCSSRWSREFAAENPPG